MNMNPKVIMQAGQMSILVGVLVLLLAWFLEVTK